MLKNKRIFAAMYMYLQMFFAVARSKKCLTLKDFNEKYKTEILDNQYEKELKADKYYLWTDVRELKPISWSITKDDKKNTNLGFFVLVENSVENEIEKLEKYNFGSFKHALRYYDCYRDSKNNNFFIMEYFRKNLETDYCDEFTRLIDNEKLKKEKEEKKKEFRKTIPESYKQFLKLSLGQRLKIYSQMAEALEEIHNTKHYFAFVDPSIFYFIDEKEPKIKIFEYFDVKSEDDYMEFLGCKFFLEKNQLQSHSNYATKDTGKKYAKKKDKWKANIWGLGIIFYVFENNGKDIWFKFQSPFWEKPKENLKILEENIFDENNWISKDLIQNTKFKEMMKKILILNRKERKITAKEIKETLIAILDSFPDEKLAKGQLLPSLISL